MEFTLVDVITISIAAAAFGFSIISYMISSRTQRNMTTSSTYSEIMGRQFELNRLEIEKPKFFTALYDEFDAEKIHKGGQGGLGHYLYMLFNLYSEIHHQHQDHGLFKKNQYEIWKSRIENDLQHRPFLKGYWAHQKQHFSNEYPKTFIDFIDERIKQIQFKESKKEQD